jgi:hypothetical protein
MFENFFRKFKLSLFNNPQYKALLDDHLSKIKSGEIKCTSIDVHTIFKKTALVITAETGVRNLETISA